MRADSADRAGFSASFHALTCHSMEVAHRFNKLDYVGIVVLISGELLFVALRRRRADLLPLPSLATSLPTGTFVPCVRYGFFCDPHLRNLYICLIYFAAACPPLSSRRSAYSLILDAYRHRMDCPCTSCPYARVSTL